MIMDNQFKNMKTNARLLSKAMWYEWRSNLLDDLMQGLVKIKKDFDNDHVVLTRYGQSIDEKLPGLEAQYEQLKTECDHLQAHADALASADREEIEALKGKVVEREAEINEKKRKLAELQAEVQLKEEQVDLLTERKSTFAEEIKEAQRVIEDCRGLSAKELTELKGKHYSVTSKHLFSLHNTYNSPHSSSPCPPNAIWLVHHFCIQQHPHSYPPSRPRTLPPPLLFWP